MIQNGPILTRGINESTNINTIPVGAGATAYSAVFNLVDLSTFAIAYQVAGTGTPNITITVECSTDNVNWFEPDNMRNIITNLTNKNLHGAQVGLVSFQYTRFKIIENTSTVSDTVVSLQLSAQKRFES